MSSSISPSRRAWQRFRRNRLGFTSLVAFVVLVLFGLLRPAEREVRSKMIGKPLPEFSLQPAIADRPGFARADMATGQPRLLNIFASWCIPCRDEHPLLEALATKRSAAPGVHLLFHRTTAAAPNGQSANKPPEIH